MDSNWLTRLFVNEAKKVLEANSDVCGELLSSGNPHKLFATDGNGEPTLVDQLAYEESVSVELFPPTDVGIVWHGLVQATCAHDGQVKIGDTGTFILDGVSHDYVAVTDTSSGPKGDVLLDMPGVSGYVKLSGKKSVYLYDCGWTSPTATHTISMTKNSTTTKTIDPKYLPEEITSTASRPTGPIYVKHDELSGWNDVVAYIDPDCTEQITYEQGVEILTRHPVMIRCANDGYIHVMSLSAVNFFINSKWATVTATGVDNRRIVFSDSDV